MQSEQQDSMEAVHEEEKRGGERKIRLEFLLRIAKFPFLSPSPSINAKGRDSKQIDKFALRY